jgi:hypothetical protein
MPDRTWAPEVVAEVAEQILTEHGRRIPHGQPNSTRNWPERAATAALSASPLGEALDLIERLTNCANDFLAAVAGESPGLLEDNCDIEHLNAGLADAAAFVARVREG